MSEQAGTAPVTSSPTRPSRRRRLPIEPVFPLGILIALCIVLSFVSSAFLTSGNITNLLGNAAVLAIVSFGVTVVLVSGHFDLSVGSTAGLSGMLAAWVMVNSGSLVLGLAAGIATGLAIGLTNGLLSTYFRVPSFIATLAMLVIARGLAQAVTKGVAVTGLPDAFTTFVSGKFLGLPNQAWIALVFFMVVYVLLHHTRLGMQIFAVGGNAEAAKLAGIDVNRVRTIAFLLSGLAGAIAGLVLTGQLFSAQPNAGELLELYSVAAVVLGGTSLYGGSGSVTWTVVGVLLITAITNGLALASVESSIQNVILGGVFIVAALTGVVRRKSG